MTMAPSDADARFDRTIDRWFRDQLAMRPEYATFFGIHDHDAELASGGRDAIDEEVAFYRRTIDELDADRPDRAERRARARPRPRHPPGAARPLLADRVPTVGRLVGRRRAHRRGALPALHARLRPAPRSAREHRRPARGGAALPGARRASASPIRCGCGPRSTSSRPSSCPAFLDTILAAARTDGGDHGRGRSARARPSRPRRPRWTSTRPGCATTSCRAPPPTGRRVRSGSRRWSACASSRPTATRSWPSARSCSRARRRPARRSPRRSIRAHRPRRWPTSSRTTTPPRSSSRWTSTAARWIVPAPSWSSTGLATPPEEDHLNVIETPSFIRHLIPFAAYYEPAKFDPQPGRDVHRHAALVAGDDARAQPRVDQQHLGPRGLPGPPPPAERRHHQPEPRAPLLRRAGVQRGLGLLLRADDEGGGLRRHARRAGTSSTPMRSGARPGSSSTSSSIAGSSASTMRSIGWSPRPASSARRRWPRSSATPRRPTYQLSYLFGRHMIEKLKAEVAGARGQRASACARSTTR